MNNQLNNLINNTIQCSINELELANKLFVKQNFFKDDILLGFGEVENNLYFINSGYLRCYYSVGDDDITISISSPEEFATSIVSFFIGEKSKMTIQCLTDCELMIISKEGLEMLYRSHSVWQEFGRKIMEKALIEKEDRLMDQICLTAEQRYLKLMQQNHGLIQHCPVKYIASFMGIHPESLSRIRKNIS
jgi:CRP-like cAMP-binding protein